MVHLCYCAALLCFRDGALVGKGPVAQFMADGSIMEEQVSTCFFLQIPLATCYLMYQGFCLKVFLAWACITMHACA